MTPWKISLKELSPREIVYLDILITTLEKDMYRRHHNNFSQRGWLTYHDGLDSGRVKGVWNPQGTTVNYRVLSFNQLVRILKIEICNLGKSHLKS